MSVTKQVLGPKLAFASSIRKVVAFQPAGNKAYQWWSFDALSDDGRDALLIIFYDNFVFSPRYNSTSIKTKVPAVAFYFYRDGKPLHRIINEFPESEFQVNSDDISVKINENQFKFESAPYGKGFMVEINAKSPGQKTLEGRLEWLFIESDFQPELAGDNLNFWNLVAPRADVTGHIKISDKKGKTTETINFRGTGCHTHYSDFRFCRETIGSFQWGRAHFSDATAVFLRLKETGSSESVNRLYIIRNSELHQREAIYQSQNFSRQMFGIKYPQRLRFISEDNIRLRVKQTQRLDSNLYNLRFLSEMTLTLRDGKPRKTLGISEHLAPKALKYRWLDWLTNMRITRKG